MSKEICDKCNKPIVAGQSRYTGLEFQGTYRHSDCHDWRPSKDVIKDVRDGLQGVRQKLDALKRRLDA